MLLMVSPTGTPPMASIKNFTTINMVEMAINDIPTLLFTK